MDARNLKYNLAEIALASGVDPKTLQARRAALVKAGEMESVKGKRSEYTYDEVKKLLRNPRKPGEPRGEYVNALKLQLKNDGYTIAKGGERVAAD